MDVSLMLPEANRAGAVYTGAITLGEIPAGGLTIN